MNNQQLTHYKHPKSNRSANHVAPPISSLRDPSTFGPPPVRHVGTRSPAAGTSAAASPTFPNASREDITAPPAPPPRHYLNNTTGLSATKLYPPPPPPVRRHGAEAVGSNFDRAPATTEPAPPKPPPRKTGPSPPSLPSRANTPSSPSINQGGGGGAIQRLSAAGISVPALGIGIGNTKQSSAAPSSASRAGPVEGGTGTAAQPAAKSGFMNSLQSRFSSSRAEPPSSPQSGNAKGTSFDQKISALRTGAALHRDPKSVSASDVWAAASTANNFRQRHGHQVSAGLGTAGNLYGKYGAPQVDRSGDGGVGGDERGSGNAQKQITSAAALLAKTKKAAPPPPPKKHPMGGMGGHKDGGTPPPVPFETRPRFSS